MKMVALLILILACIVAYAAKVKILDKMIPDEDFEENS
jgi:hypothetical protein